MKVTKEIAQQHHDDLVQAASHIMRKRGIEATGVSDVCRAAGLTHGAFYRHFESKEALILEACAAAFQWTITDIDDVDAPGRSALPLIERYLSTAHRDAPGSGCPVAALACDVSRGGTPLADVFSSGIRRYIDAFAEVLPETQSRARAAGSRRARAIKTLSGMVGALILARAAARSDPELSAEILEAARKGAQENAKTSS